MSIELPDAKEMGRRLVENGHRVSARDRMAQRIVNATDHGLGSIVVWVAFEPGVREWLINKNYRIGVSLLWYTVSW